MECSAIRNLCGRHKLCCFKRRDVLIDCDVQLLSPHRVLCVPSHKDMHRSQVANGGAASVYGGRW